MRPKQPETLDVNEFLNAFTKESDRACAVLARALLEYQIRKLIEGGFTAKTTESDKRAIFESHGPLSTFSSRILLAKNLGMISAEEASDLNGVRYIGNAFAHRLDHEMTFEYSSFRDRIFSLHSPHLLKSMGGYFEQPIPESEIEDMDKRARRRFEVAVGLLWLQLAIRKGRIKKAEVPENVIK